MRVAKASTFLNFHLLSGNPASELNVSIYSKLLIRLDMKTNVSCTRVRSVWFIDVYVFIHLSI